MATLGSKLRNSGMFGLRLYHELFGINLFFQKLLYSDRKLIQKRYKSVFGKTLNLDNPTTLTEKMQWIKLYQKESIRTICADKYEVRNYLREKFGEKYLIPLLYQTDNYRDITKEVIPDCNCILKANHDCGHYLIIRNKDEVDIETLRENCRFWLNTNYYDVTREFQYKNIKPRIIIEKLLETKEGKIPNDYKFHFINGEFQFVYVSYDREGVNDRCTYDEKWNRLPFLWVPANTYKKTMNTTDVPKPASFDKMMEFGKIIAKDFDYVRVDYYDVDGHLYFGEVTLIHGAGHDTFFPEKYDKLFGEKLRLKGLNM